MSKVVVINHLTLNGVMYDLALDEADRGKVLYHALSHTSAP